ncbi:MAG TPA: ricin-type beta-trefoil lectin domain protein, partial [Verrucomicrobiae bacterium]|nr:ricin-type beta-trefoil lectin domain protein [Verrucomicrobiae bacterium]
MHHAVPDRPTPLMRNHSRRWAWLVVIAIVILAAPLLITTKHGQAASSNAITSGIFGNCLDVYHSDTVSGTPIDLAHCNGSAAQDWTTTATTIRHMGDGGTCIGVTTAGVITLQPCTDAAGQVWLRDRQGYYNPDKGECLSASKVGTQLELVGCGDVSSAGEIWNPESGAQAPACSGSEGDMVACEAVKQWTAWQAANSNHEALLTTYTDGTPYEEWCADFVSYIYKQAGYPFTNGSADGWDENDANAVRYMGFTMHTVGSGYTPRAGDIAFFDYPGGHVEIVVSGGNTPTFVYGNSPVTDPTTNNGDMASNTITHDDGGVSGQLVYYLSPTT